MKKDFRTAYLNTLGFKGSQLKSSLEAIFEHRVIDLVKLKKICNIFEIPTQYRCRVWKILLGVTSSHQETWEFIHEQRTIEYDDLKHAVNLVRRGSLPDHFYNQWREVIKQYSMDSDEQVVLEAKDIAADSLSIIYHTKEQYFNFHNGLYYINDSSDFNFIQQQHQLQQRSLSPSTTTTPPITLPPSSSIFDHNNQTSVNSKSNINNNTTDNNNNSNNNNNNNNIDRDLEQLVEEYTGSKPNLNASNSNGQPYDDSLKLIAEVFCYVCETEVDAFWCFNNFLNKSFKQYGHKDIGIYHQINILTRLLDLYERPLLNHLHQLGIHVDQFSTKWFKTYFTSCFPTTSIDRVWDRIIGVSLDYMGFIALSILQSKKGMIFEKKSSSELLNYLLNIKDINIDMVLEKAVEYYTNTNQ